jgi:CspA family cold shock protein
LGSDGPYNSCRFGAYKRGYQSQIDGIWRFAAPFSFSYSLLLAPKVRLFGPHVKDIIMPIGTVKFFNESKGYGFIQPDGGGNDAFVHISAVERAGMSTLQQDQRVSYDVEDDQRGKSSAVNLQAADDKPAA